MELSMQYDGSNRRPTKDLVTQIWAWCLEEMNDWTVRDTVRMVRGDRDTQWALGLPENPTNECCLLKEKSFYDFRNKFVDIDGPPLGAKAIVSNFCKEHCTKIKIVRLDATYVLPNIANRSRGGLFQEFLRFSVREHPKAFPEGKGRLDRECLNRYDESRKVGYDRYGQAKAKEKPLIR
jgi:hypothetical protein